MPKLLVKFSGNYADEFQVSGFTVMEKKDWEQYVKDAKAGEWPQARSFGTNEGIQWESVEDHLDAFNTIEITDEQAVFLLTSFTGYGEQGHVLMIDDFSEPSELY